MNQTLMGETEEKNEDFIVKFGGRVVTTSGWIGYGVSEKES